MRNPNLSYRPIGFSLVPISFRFCVVSLVICPNSGEAPRQTRGSGVCFTPGNMHSHNHFEYRRL